MFERHAPFTYNRLKPGEIRLLYSSGPAKETVWSLRTTNLYTSQYGNDVAFDALSYTWGDLSDIFTFTCNDQELQIHSNLKEALPYLAKRQSSLPIWIDAICINQLDDAEKLAQIRMMHSIYSRASQVWVWLGCVPDGGKEAITLLPRIAQVGKELEDWNMEQFPRPTPESKNLPSLSSSVWSSLYQLIYNPWFFRLWAMQEAALAKCIRVLYGSNEIDWKVLEEAVEFGTRLGHYLLDSNRQKPRTGNVSNYNVFLIREMVQDPSRHVPWQNHLLRTLLLTLKSHQCSSPYDRVFGVLGFVTDDQIEQIRLDDNPSLVDIYTRFGRFLLGSVGPSKSNWWALLNMAPASTKLPGLPTWCPDFHALSGLDAAHLNSLSNTIPSSKYKGNVPYYASRGTSFATQSSNLYQLPVRGKIFDTVSRVYAKFPHASKFRVGGMSMDEFSNMLLDVGIWEKTLAEAILEAQTSSKDPMRDLQISRDGDKVPIKRTLDDYWRTLVGNLTERTDYTITCDRFHIFRRGLEAWAKYIQKYDWKLDTKL